jgi:hypothetical protein
MVKSRKAQNRLQPTSVEQALDRFWKSRSPLGCVPDYSGFEEWVASKTTALTELPPLPLHAEDLPNHCIKLLLDLLAAATKLGITVTAEGAVVNPIRPRGSADAPSSIKQLNRMKLIYSFFASASPRLRGLVLLLAEPEVSAIALRATSSQLDYRIAFFKAVASGDGHMAFKIVGKLKEEDHDAGEVSFLEATASFHSNRLEEAVQYARAVPKFAIDYRRAFMLVLEAFALQGDVARLSDEIERTPILEYPAFFLAYVFQVAIANSTDPEHSLIRLNPIFDRFTTPSHPGEGAFRIWNRYSCQLGVQFVEQQRDSLVKRLAMQQSLSDKTDEVPTLRELQVECALRVDNDLGAKLFDVDLERAAQYIEKRLLGVFQPVTKDYIQALVTHWRIGDRLHFLGSVVANIEFLVSLSTNETWKIIVWAYQEAQIQQRTENVELLRSRLLGSPEMAEKLSEIENDVTLDRIERQLSAMGKMALRSANWDLSHASEGISLWRDAGMISLGFFRILELEFNERLIFPITYSLNLDELEICFEHLRAGELVGARKKAVAFWERLIRPLRDAKQQRKGLDLGTLETLLQKVTELKGPDHVLKARIQSSLLTNLSHSGLEAFTSGELARLVSASVREKFRNPPAHSRYTSLATAEECKKYVLTALEKLTMFTIA